jgi:hypothetical protein
LLEETDDLLISKSGLFDSRYSPKLVDFVPSLWYGRERSGEKPKPSPYVWQSKSKPEITLSLLAA